MDAQELVDAIFKAIAEREQYSMDSLRAGVKDWTAYNRIIGEMSGVAIVRSDIMEILKSSMKDDV